MGALFTLKKLFFLKNIDSFKEMEKIEYKAPEMEILEVKLNRNVLLAESGGPGFDEGYGDE